MRRCILINARSMPFSEIGGSLWVTGALHLNLGATHIRRHELELAFAHLHDSQELFEQAKVRDLLPESNT